MSDIVKETVEISDVTKVRLGSIGKLHLKQGEEESLLIETSDEIMDLVKVKVSNGELSLGLKNRIRKQRFFDDFDLDYYLTIKDISGLSLSGATSAEVDDLEVKSFVLETSGATKSTFAVIKTTDLKLSSSGASKIALDDLQTETFKLDLSGATKIESDRVTAENLNARLSGACVITFKEGKVNSQDLELSGASKVNLSNVESTEIKFRSSGAGKASVWATEELDISISGVGKLSYKGRPHIRQNTSGPVKITNINE